MRRTRPLITSSRRLSPSSSSSLRASAAADIIGREWICCFLASSSFIIIIKNESRCQKRGCFFTPIRHFFQLLLAHSFNINGWMMTAYQKWKLKPKSPSPHLHAPIPICLLFIVWGQRAAATVSTPLLARRKSCVHICMHVIKPIPGPSRPHLLAAGNF